MPKATKCFIATTVTFFLLWGSATRARADQKTQCTVFDIRISGSADPYLVFHCQSDVAEFVTYYAGNSRSCPVLTFDQVKTWTNILTAAFVSGKTLTITFTTQPPAGNCAGATTVDAIFLAP